MGQDVVSDDEHICCWYFQQLIIIGIKHAIMFCQYSHWLNNGSTSVNENWRLVQLNIKIYVSSIIHEFQSD